MRNLLKFIVVFLLTVTAVSANGQTLKFGHIDLQALVQVMPERATAETQFNAFQGEVEEVFNGMQKELQQKYAELEQLGDSASEIKKNAKITEVQDLNQRLQNYQTSAQQQIQQKYSELLKPVFDKATKAIEEVAIEKGLIYVFDTPAGGSTVLYKSNQSLDLLPLVKQKLGIQ
jgi:outer membrane protein